MCQCSQLQDCVETFPTREGFVLNFELIESRLDLWSQLYQCRFCNQFWRIEAGAEADRRSNRGFKVPARNGWHDFDIMPALEAFCINKLGGLSDSNCSFAGCSKKALVGKVVCIQHGPGYQ
jgi:hypothetical protein